MSLLSFLDMTHEELMKQRDYDIATGGTECSLEDAMNLVATRRKVRGYFPVVYPLKGGGYVHFATKEDIEPTDLFLYE